MRLMIEARIGQLSLAEPQIQSPKNKEPGGIGGGIPSGEPPKHKRLGLKRRQRQTAQTIARHPERRSRDCPGS